MTGEYKVMHMNAGNGDFSYANNSTLQRKVILEAKPVLEDAIEKMFQGSDIPKCLRMADLGCSSGPNALIYVSNVVEIVLRLCHEDKGRVPEFQVFLNDLPDNDFNTIFGSIPSFYQKLKEKDVNCFISGSPGSFYDRIFPSKSLDIVHSSYSLHWLSQAPKGLENKKNIYIGRTSPPHVCEAYLKQFENDFSRFLCCRSQELVSGGYMVLTVIGRSVPNPFGSHCTILELLSKSLLDLVYEGLIQEAELDSFNLPHYRPHKDEIERVVRTEGSFNIDSLKFFQTNWDDRDDDGEDDDRHFDAYSSGRYKSKIMRAVMEQFIVSHFRVEESTIDHLFERYACYIGQHLMVEKTKYFNIVISLRKI